MENNKNVNIQYKLLSILIKLNLLSLSIIKMAFILGFDTKEKPKN